MRTRHRISVRAAQRGIATILILLLTGLSLTAAVLGTVYYVRGTQEQQVSSHAMTQAQVKAWTGVEVIKVYLTSLSQDDLKVLGAATKDNKIELTLAGVSGVTAKVVGSDAVAGTKPVPTQLTVEVTGTTAGGTRAQSTSTVQVVYALASTSASKGTPKAVNIKGDLALSGEIILKGAENYDFSVDGNIDTNKGTIVGFNSIFATGHVNLDSDGNRGAILAAKGDISVTNTSYFDVIKSMGKVTIKSPMRGKDGTSPVGLIYANDNVLIKSSALINDVKTRGAAGFDGNSSVRGTVLAKGNINTGSVAGVAALQGEGDFTASSYWPTDGIRGEVKGVGTKQGTVNVGSNPNLVVNVPALVLDDLTSSEIDAYALKGNANYAFEMEGTNVRVTVSNINGIARGAYYLSEVKENNVTYTKLCSDLAKSVCPYVLIVDQGNSKTSRLAYNSTFGWILTAPTAMMPGVLWFEGSLTIDGGTYNNTIISTGNILTKGGSPTVFALNSAQYVDICQGNFLPSANKPFSNYPSNFCPGSASVQPPTLSQVMVGNISVGSVALLAGGYKVDPVSANRVFSGGKITLGSNSNIHGDLTAADVVETSGAATIYGYVTTGHQSGSSTTTNKFSASTTIILDGSRPGDGSAGSGAGSGASSATTARVLWSRYL
ncbi:hypothetical protein JHS3_22780 [Jeongeupia sp. HS-3]|nr:hypothetical protein JHS3_22780 [Jeongeupia sp. HS-3]